MKIKELHPDMERYLTHGCYCDGEIYDAGGFFYVFVDKDDSCKLLYKDGEYIACRWDKKMLVFHISENKLDDSRWYDATENNINGMLNYFKTGEPFSADSFKQDKDMFI